MRRGIAALSILTIGLALTACSSGGTPAATNTGTSESPSAAASQPAASGSITIWCDDTRTAPMKALGEKYTAQTGVTVNVVEKDVAKVRDDFVAQAPGGGGPDIVVGAHDWLGKLVQNGVVAPLQLGDKEGQFQKVAIQAMTYDGQIYGVPYAIENIALVRNTELAPEAPKTMDEAIANGKKLVDEGKAKFPFLIQQDSVQGDPYHMYPIQMSFGAPVFAMNADGSYDSSKLELGNAGGVEFAKYVQKLGKEGVLKNTISGDIAKQAFIDKQSPYIISGPWNTPDFTAKGVKYVVEAIPPAGDKPAQPFVGVQGLFVSQFAKNPLAANDFVVNYMSTKESQLTMYEVAGRGPALTAAAEDPSVTSNQVIADFAKVGADGVPMPNIPAMDAVWNDWGTTEVQIETQKGDPTKLWNNMVAAIEKKIAAS